MKGDRQGFLFVASDVEMDIWTLCDLQGLRAGKEEGDHDDEDGRRGWNAK